MALLHRTIPATFTNLYLPETRNALWSSDIDMQADPALLTRLSEKSGLSVDLLHDMTLESYEGFLFERAFKSTGGTLFVNPLGLRGRRSRLPGLRFCPACLREDDQPYFRKKWRLSFSVACLTHRCFLLDRCPECDTPFTPYLSCKTGRIGACYKCSLDYVAKDVKVQPASSGVLCAVQKVHAVLNDGYALVGGVPVYSQLYFRVVHQLMKVLASRKSGPRLFAGIGLEWSTASEGRTFEAVALQGQAELLAGAAWLLEDWPHRLIAVCTRQGVLSSSLLRDLDEAPFWYWRVIHELLYRPDRIVSEEEIRAAVGYMKRQGMQVSECSLSELLGVQQIFRKRDLSFLLKKEGRGEDG